MWDVELGAQGVAYVGCGAMGLRIWDVELGGC